MTTHKVIGCMRPDGGAGCEITLGCAGCNSAIHDYATPPARACGTCHYACDCREHKVAVLIKAALDAATELDGLQAAWAASYPGDESVKEVAENHRATVERVYDACEQLGEKIGRSADEGVPA
jgi:hypothetical protein